MRLPSLYMGDVKVKVPIIQGGMGIGVSRAGLASAVANEGGIGVISGVQIGFMEPDFETNNGEANVRGLTKEIRKARQISPNGILGVNLMVAMNNYMDLARAAVEEKIDLIISGAGLPSELPKVIKDTKTKIAPIVSSAKAAALIAKLWDKKHNYTPDLVVVEGPEAGGHLGFSVEDLGEKKLELSNIVKDVIETLKPYEDKYNKKIPVIAAGGISTGADIAKYIKLGAAGVQIATRFVATEECDAHINYKLAYVNAKKDDIMIIKSPVGLPGRAIKNEFIESITNNNLAVKKCYSCLKHCNPANTIYCISEALLNAVKGNIKEGLIFTGSNSYMIDKITTVKELMEELVAEAEYALA